MKFDRSPERDGSRYRRHVPPHANALLALDGNYARVEAVDREANLLIVSGPDGRRIEYNPVRRFGVELFREEKRTIARGERIQFRAPEKTLRLADGEFANIDAIDDRRAVLRLDNGRQLSAALDRLRHIDHGYASTSHSAQGATVDHAIPRGQCPAPVSNDRLVKSVFTFCRELEKSRIQPVRDNQIKKVIFFQSSLAFGFLSGSL